MEAQTPAVETTPAETGHPPAAPPRRFAWGFWIFLTVGLVAAMGACDVYNYDVGLHLAKGRWIVGHHSLPRPEEFITAKRPGYVYQDRWLFQVATWIVYSAGGWPGLTLVKIGFVLLTFGLLWTGSRPAGPAACAMATLLAALLMYERWDIRSELSIHLAFAAMIAIAGRGDRVGKWIWAAPAVAALGANLHSVNIGAPTLLLIPMVTAFWKRDRAAAKTWAAVAAASFAALMLNPQGPKIYAIPVEYLWRSSHGPDWYRGWITEMQPVTADLAFPSVTLRAIWVVVPVAALLFAANWKRARLFDLGLLVMGAVFAFSFRRNIALAGVLLCPVIARNLHELALEWAGRVPAAARTAAQAALAAAVAVTALLWTSDLVAVAERTVRREGLGISHLSLPVDACDFLEREGFEGNAFVNWDAGPYYNLRRSPKSLPCMNAEGDWNLETLKEYDDVTKDPVKLFEEYAARYALELAVMTVNSHDTRPVTSYLSVSPRWALVWQDECAVVFARREGPNAKRVEKFGVGNDRVPPPSCRGADPGGIWPWSEGARRSEAVRSYRVGTLHALFRRADQRECYERAIRLWPGYPEAHNNLGAFLAEARQPGADEELRESLRLSPSYGPAARNLATYTRRHGNDVAGAARILTESLGHAENPDVMVDLARIEIAGRIAGWYRSQQDGEEARRVLALFMQFRDAQELLDEAAQGGFRGDDASAARAAALLRRALVLRPGHAEAQRLLDIAEAMQKP